MEDSGRCVWLSQTRPTRRLGYGRGARRFNPNQPGREAALLHIPGYFPVCLCCNISGAVDFVKAVGESNGLHDSERWLAPWDIAQLGKGEWAMQHDPADFHPMTVETATIEEPAEVLIPDMDL